MGLEIVGGRLMAVHYGSSVYVWGSLITVFLAALSGGYFWGGMLADRLPSYRPLAALVIVAGILILIIPILDRPIENSIRRSGLGLMTAPLLFASAVFLVPSMLIGMVSPYVIKLTASRLRNIGQLTGNLYAISSLGSICGTLLTTFVLIPHFRLNVIIVYILGSSMILIGLILLWRSVSSNFFLLITLVLISATTTGIPLVNAVANRRRGDSRLIFKEDTPYQSISVEESGTFRLLSFGRFCQGRISLIDCETGEPTFEDGFHLAFVFNPSIKKVLFIGGGACIGPQKFLEDYSDITVDVVELDPVVLEVAHRFFYLPWTAGPPMKNDDGLGMRPFSHFLDNTGRVRLRTYADDGRILLERSSKKWDLIVLDAFNTGGRIPFTLMTEEFLMLAQSRLTAPGIILTNLISALEGKRSGILNSVRKTYMSVFGNFYAFPLMPLKFAPQNIIGIAHFGRSRLSKAEIVLEASDLEEKGLIKVRNFAKLANQVHIGETERREGEPPRYVLTDQFAPVEMLAPW